MEAVKAVAWEEETNNIVEEPLPYAEDAESELALCVICYENPSGARLLPCGHDHFCRRCARGFRTCPLCRRPVAMQNGVAVLEDGRSTSPDPMVAGGFPNTGSVPGQQPVISKQEAYVVIAICVFVWIFIFIGGMVEWCHNVPSGAGPMCKEVHEQRASSPVCAECHEGFFQIGRKCVEHLDDIPPVKTGAALGGMTYYVLIVLLQFAGAASELALIRRLRRRGVMPTKELMVLLIALSIEILRMLMVDIFVLQEYFNGSAYQIYRTPVSCSSFGADMEDQWYGSDGNQYCGDTTPYHSGTRYFIASQMTAFSSNTEFCSTFTSSSALLDYDETSGTWGAGGHPRFSRLGWVIGGEFAMYYFFATFVNEVADNIFVVPTTAHNGIRWKVFSVALELFQLGALCPAAIFSHSACLHYTDPLGVPLTFIRDIIVTFGYCIWGFLVAMIPLSLVGVVLLGMVSCIGIVFIHLLVGPTRRLRGDQAARDLEQWRVAAEGKAKALFKWYTQSMHTILIGFVVFSFIPLLLSGMFLGTLVVVGQASKQGAMQILTAIVLLSDVLFKIVATAVTEIFEYILHVRVRRAVANGSGRRGASSDAGSRPRDEVVGRPRDTGDAIEGMQNNSDAPVVVRTCGC